MIKNVVLKKCLKQTVFKIISIFNTIIPKDDSIVLLYSANKGIQHSLLPLRKYLLDNGFNKRYHIICGIENMKYAEDNIDVEFVSRLHSYQIYLKAKYIFYTTGQIPIKPSKKQCVIHLRHGNTNFKTSGKKTNIHNGDEFFFTYMIASASIYKKIMCEEYGCKEENIVIAGDPLIDELLSENHVKYDFSIFKKVILWVPTFRQSDYLGYDDSNIEELVPLYEESEYEELNNILKKKNIKLIVKLHPAQRNFGGAERHFSHFNIYTNDEFTAAGYKLYSLMAQSDALVGDYSSASMQYLVLDKPQAYVIPDIEEYRKKRGFVFKNPEEYMAGHIVKTKDEFMQFIDDMENERDPYLEKRKDVRRIMYEYPDNHNCERIIKLSGMR